MQEITFRLIYQPVPLTAVELSRLSLSHMNLAVDRQELIASSQLAVHNDEQCVAIIDAIKNGAQLKAKVNKCRNAYFIGDVRVSSKIIYKLQDNGYIT